MADTKTSALAAGTAPDGTEKIPAVQGGATVSLTAAQLGAQTAGSWTPAVKFGGNSVGMTYTTQVGRYIRIGDMVTAWLSIDLSAKGSSTGNFTITGLPFTSKNVAGLIQGVNPGIHIGEAATKRLMFYIQPNTTSIVVFDATNGSTATDADLAATSTLYLVAHYYCEP